MAMNLKRLTRRVGDSSYGDRIAQKKQSINNSENDKVHSLMEEMYALRDEILSYKDFAQECLDICYELNDNGFIVVNPLWSQYVRRKDLMAVVMSDGVNHAFGVIGKGSVSSNGVAFYGIGSEGGGYSGETLYFDPQRDCVAFSNDTTSGNAPSIDDRISRFRPDRQYPDIKDFINNIISKEKAWLNNVEGFKTEFYGIVDKLLE